MTATVEIDNFTVFTYENLLIHASPPPVKYSLHLRRYYLLIDPEIDRVDRSSRSFAVGVEPSRQIQQSRVDRSSRSLTAGVKSSRKIHQSRFNCSR